MDLILMKTRFPAEIRECTPFLIGGRRGTIAILCDGDCEGYEPISRKEAEAIVQEFTGFDIMSFVKIAHWENLIIHC